MRATRRPHRQKTNCSSSLRLRRHQQKGEALRPGLGAGSRPAAFPRTPRRRRRTRAVRAGRARRAGGSAHCAARSRRIFMPVRRGPGDGIVGKAVRGRAGATRAGRACRARPKSGRARRARGRAAARWRRRIPRDRAFSWPARQSFGRVDQGEGHGMEIAVGLEEGLRRGVRPGRAAARRRRNASPA